MSISHPVTIIGAGITGLATATALAQRGAQVTVLEQAPELAEVGAGLQISPNGVAVLEKLGLRAKAAALANAPAAVELRDYSGSSVARILMGPQAERRWGYPFWQFHRADLLALLAQAAKDAGVDIQLGREVKEVSQADGVNQISGTDFEHTATILIGADGVRSNLRTMLFGGGDVRFTGQVAWRGLVPATSVPTDILPNSATVHMGPGKHIVTYPLRGGTLWNFVAVEERKNWVAEGWTEPGDVQELRAAFRGWSAPVTTLLDAVDETFLWGLFDHPALPSWVSGTAALVGDACHPMLPFLAQGATMGLEDAWVMADALDNFPDAEDALKTYEARRKPRATRVQKAAAQNATAYHLRNPLLRGISHAGLRGVSGVAPALLAGRFDWLYKADVTKG